MAAIVRNGTPTTQNATSTSLSVALPSGVLPGDVVIVVFSTNASGLSLTPPSGYMQVPNCFENTNNTAGVYYHIYQSGDPTSVSFAISGGTNHVLVAICSAYTNVNAVTGPIDASAGATEAATKTHNSPSCSAAAYADMLLMLYSFQAAPSTLSSPSEGSIAASISVTSGGACLVEESLSIKGATGGQTVTSANSVADSGFQVALWGSSSHSQSMAAAAFNGAPQLRGTTNQTANASSLTVNLPSGIQNNDIVIVLLSAAGSGGAITGFSASGYTEVPNCFQASGFGAGVYYHVWKTGDSTAPVFTVAGLTGTVVMEGLAAAYLGVNALTPFDGSNSQANTTSTSLASPSISPALSTSARLLMLYGLAGSVNFSAPSLGAIEAGAGGSSVCLADAPLNASGATGSQTITISITQPSIGFQIALNPSVVPAIVKSAEKNLGASASASVSISRAMAKSLVATSAGVVSLIKQIGKNVSASAAGAAGITRSIGKNLSASAATAASFVRSVGKDLAAVAAGDASIGKGVGKTLEAAGAGVASFTKSIGKMLSAAAGAIANLIGINTTPISVPPVNLYSEVAAAALMAEAPVIAAACLSSELEGAAVFYVQVR